MGAQLNIKDPETIELARSLAQQLGKSVTETIREALKEKAAKRASERQAKLDALNAIVAEIQANLPPETRAMTSKEMMDDLYDEFGAPK